MIVIIDFIIKVQSLLPGKIYYEEPIVDYGNSVNYFAIFVLIVMIVLILLSIFIAIYLLRKYFSGDKANEKRTLKVNILIVLLAIFPFLMFFIIGLYIVIGLQGSNYNPVIYQTCVAAPNSEGCRSCSESSFYRDSKFDSALFSTTIEQFSREYDDSILSKFENIRSLSQKHKCAICEWGYFRASRDDKKLDDVLGWDIISMCQD